MQNLFDKSITSTVFHRLEMEETQKIAFQIQDPSRGPVVGWILSIKQNIL